MFDVYCLGLTHWFLIALLCFPIAITKQNMLKHNSILFVRSFQKKIAIKSRMRTNHLNLKSSNDGHTENDLRELCISQNYHHDCFFVFFIYCCYEISFSILCDLPKQCHDVKHTYIKLITTSIEEFKKRTGKRERNYWLWGKGKKWKSNRTKIIIMLRKCNIFTIFCRFILYWQGFF